MKPRVDFLKVAYPVVEAMLSLEKYLHQSAIEEPLRNLVYLRASQVNGCAYCIDMHWKDLRAAGESEQRLYGLDAWEESSYYSERERAALAWTEAVTRVTEGHVSDEVYEKVRKHLTEKELADLTLAIVAINGWNRLNICCEDRAWNISTGENAGIAKTSLSNKHPAPSGSSRSGAEVNYELGRIGSHRRNGPGNRPAGLAARPFGIGAGPLAGPTEAVWRPDRS